MIQAGNFSGHLGPTMFFDYGFTMADLQESANFPKLNEEFAIVMRAGAMTSEHFLTRHVGIGSNEQDLGAIHFNCLSQNPGIRASAFNIQLCVKVWL